LGGTSWAWCIVAYLDGTDPSWHRFIHLENESQLDIASDLLQRMRRGEAADKDYRKHVDTSLLITYAQIWLPSLNIEPLFDWHAAVIDWVLDQTIPTAQSQMAVRIRHCFLEIASESRRRMKPAPADAANSTWIKTADLAAIVKRDASGLLKFLKPTSARRNEVGGRTGTLWNCADLQTVAAKEWGPQALKRLEEYVEKHSGGAKKLL